MTERSPDLTTADLALCAHDLRGILTVIAGYTALLRRDDLTPEDRVAAHDGIDAAIARADALVGDTLAGRVSARRLGGRVDLAAIVRQSAADSRVATGRDVRDQVEDACVVTADPVALARVFENLLSNAAKYAPQGTIDISLRAEGDHGIVEVADRGPGIPVEEREAVFEPFARLDRDAEKPGTGLGLVVVRGAVERAGGRVAVLDREGGGTVIRVELPLCD